jgi:hypothetical protein
LCTSFGCLADASDESCGSFVRFRAPLHAEKEERDNNLEKPLRTRTTVCFIGSKTIRAFRSTFYTTTDTITHILTLR